MDEKISQKLTEIILGTRRNSIIWTPQSDNLLLGKNVISNSERSIDKEEGMLSLERQIIGSPIRDAYQLTIHPSQTDDIKIHSNEYPNLVLLGDNLFGYDLHQNTRLAGTEFYQ